MICSSVKTFLQLLIKTSRHDNNNKKAYASIIVFLSPVKKTNNKSGLMNESRLTENLPFHLKMIKGIKGISS